MLTIAGIDMHEPDVVFTDLILFVESAAFAVLLARAAPGGVLRRLFAALFVFLAAGSLIGAAFHAFFPAKVTTSGGLMMWILTTASIGGVAGVLWCVNALLLKGERALKAVAPFAVAYALALPALVALGHTNFVVSMAFYVPPMVLFTVVACMAFARTRERAWGYVFGGLVLSFVAAAVQFLGIGLHPAYFDHNAFYHLIQAIALAAMFLGMRSIVGVGAGGAAPHTTPHAAQ